MSASCHTRARHAFPRNLRAQAAFCRGFMAELGDEQAKAELTDCYAERVGVASAREGVNWSECPQPAGRRGDYVDPARQRQLAQLAVSSPLRANAGRVIAAQADAGHLPLFIAANEPALF